MKKLILAAAVATVASFNASAEVTVGGELEYRFTSAETSSEKFADNEVVVGASYEILDGVMATTDITIEDTLSSTIGVDFGAFAVSWGANDSASNAFGVESSIVLGSDGAFTGEGSNAVLAVTTDLGPASVTLTNEDSGSGASGTDLLIKADLDAVAVKVGYQSATDDTFGAAVSFDAGVATLAADYSSNDTKDVTVFAVKAPLAATTTAAAGVINTDVSGTETTKWYAGVSYKFPMAKNVKVYSEIYDEDTAAGTGIAAGLEIQF